MPAVISPLTEAELETATALCLRSKAHWGYDLEFMAACRDELTLRKDDVADGLAVAICEGGTLLGVAQISEGHSQWELEKLFVDPPAIGRGLGARLFDWATNKAAEGGGNLLAIAADPDAAAFYRRMGAVDVGVTPSESITGRNLPLLHYRIETRP